MRNWMILHHLIFQNDAWNYNFIYNFDAILLEIVFVAVSAISCRFTNNTILSRVLVNVLVLK